MTKPVAVSPAGRHGDVEMLEHPILTNGIPHAGLHFDTVDLTDGLPRGAFHSEGR